MDFLGSILAAPWICIGWIIVGALAGIIANRIMKSPTGIVGDIITGLVGAIIGGFILSILGVNFPDGGVALCAVNLVGATVGAIVLVGALNMVRRRT
jgi:uncharacterized membrane protein YeaQ/YmgE (transglycosylase-associated protein family)